jgi:hypothetical protein
MKYDIFQTLFISMQLLLIAPTSNCIAAYTVTEPERNLDYFQDEFQNENEIDYYYSNYGYEADLECCLTLPAFEEEIG